MLIFRFPAVCYFYRHVHESYRMESWLANTDAHIISVSAWEEQEVAKREHPLRDCGIFAQRLRT